MSNHVVVLGSCCVCHMFTAKELPVRGETVIGNDYQIVVGGKGSGQAVVACKLGSDVYIMEHLGDDAYGIAERDSYVKMGMHTEFVHIDENTPTGFTGIYMNHSGQNAIIVVPGANNHASCKDIDEMESVLKDAKIIGTQLEIPVETVEYAIRKASEMGVRTLLDPAPVTDISEDLFPCISIIKPNECEASSLTGIPVTDTDSAFKAARALLAKGVKEAVIITLGDKGVVMATREREVYIPGIPVVAIDTGGAGDTFAGALLVALAQDWDLEKAICYAQCASALCVTRKGAYSLTDKDEVEKLFREQYPDLAK